MKLFKVMMLSLPVKVLNLVICVVPAYFMWNWFIPDIFSLPEIEFIQMVGLIILIQCFRSRGFISVNAE